MVCLYFTTTFDENFKVYGNLQFTSLEEWGGVGVVIKNTGVEVYLSLTQDRPVVVVVGGEGTVPRYPLSSDGTLSVLSDLVRLVKRGRRSVGERSPVF